MKNLNIVLIIVLYFLIQFSYGQNNYTVSWKNGIRT